MNESPPAPDPEIPNDGLAELGGLSPRDLFVDGLRTPAAAGQWEPPSAEHVAKLLPQFRVEALIGHGGMGAVYKAAQPRLDRFVAIKLLPAELAANDEFVARFEREARTLAKLHHPNIVGIHDFGQTTEGHLYFVMEFVDGTDLARIITTGALGATQALELTVQICEALQYAHSQHVIHRDIKPANVLVTQEGQAKLADFGLARPLSEVEANLTASHLVMGTPDYMAPEQRAGLGDHRVDIYALGVMLYEMLTGRRPRGVFDPPSMKVQVDVRLDEVVVKAMREEPERRYQQASEMRIDVDRIRSTPQPKQQKAPAKKQTAQPAFEKASLPPAKARRARPATRAWVLPLVAVAALAMIAIAMVQHGWFSSSSSPKAPGTESSNDGGNTTSAPPPSSAPPLSPFVASKNVPLVNSLGMPFVPVPIIGGPTSGQKVLFAIWDTRVRDYEVFAKETGRSWLKAVFAQEPNHPAINVSWDDAQAFCQWLTSRDLAKGTLPTGWRYRLPSDHEWSCAVGVGDREDPAKLPSEKSGKISDVFPWGDTWPPPEKAGNFAGDELTQSLAAGQYLGVIPNYHDDYANTSPVGSFAANRGGLYDMGGNVQQWCEDWFDRDRTTRVLRGASWNRSDRGVLQSSFRSRTSPATRSVLMGFRCVIAPNNVPATVPNPASATKESPFANSLGMKFVPVPGADILMCIHETRKGDYAAYANANPGTNAAWKNVSWNGEPVSKDNSHPVVMVNWDDANAFCAWLSKREGLNYRLPTDREWSWAVGIASREKASLTPGDLNEGIQSEYPWGTAWPPPKDAGNYSDDQWKRQFPGQEPDGFPTTSPVMSFKPNSLGIYDLGGNVWEWCQDWWDRAQVGRVLRGSSWFDFGIRYPLSSRRIFIPPNTRSDHYGFRCVISAATAVASAPFPATPPLSPVVASKNAPLVNSLGMKFVPVPGTKVLFSIWDTRVQDYEVFAKETMREWPKAVFEQGPTHPAVFISWNDAGAFCTWLTERERKDGRINAGDVFRLPTDHEWSCAVGIGNREDPARPPNEKSGMLAGVFPWGTQWPPPAGAGNYASEELRPKLPQEKSWMKEVIPGYWDGYSQTSPVGSFAANPQGLYDLGGNVWQWCEDWYDEEHETHVLRGGSWANNLQENLLSSYRPPHVAAVGYPNYGFRCVLEPGTSSATPPSPSPRSTTAMAEATKDVPFENQLGMKFVPVPGTNLLMCIHETRKGDYAHYASENSGVDDSWRHPSDAGVPVSERDDHPVVNVSWNDAHAFCAWLTKKEGRKYRLPTDHEWSIAVGIGDREDLSATPQTLSDKLWDIYPWGSAWPPPKNAGNFADSAAWEKLPGKELNGKIEGYDDGYATTSPVMSFTPNALGIYDLSGNVYELCEDWFNAAHLARTVRGASYQNATKAQLRSADRGTAGPDARIIRHGFRCVLDLSSNTATSATPSAPKDPSAVSDWRYLFDGKSFKGWDPDTTVGWRVDVENSALMSYGGGMLRCEKLFRSFELEVEWRASPMGKGGLYYAAQGKAFAIVPKFSLGDPQAYQWYKYQPGGLFNVLPPSKDATRPVGQWNTARLVVSGSHREHWINGIQVLNYDLDNESYKQALADSPHREDPAFSKPVEGNILLGSSNEDVAYRNVRVRELPDVSPSGQNAFIASPSAGNNGWISLLPKVAPKTDATLGKWSPVAGGLQAQAVDGQALLELPYEPPAEYDYHVVFTATDKRAETIQVLRAGGHNFRWTTNGASDARAGFDTISGKAIQDSPASLPQPSAPVLNRRYESLVEVRRDRVSGYLDGRKLVEWKTDYSNMGLVPGLTLRDPKRLALGIWQGTTTFHDISVREVTGKGVMVSTVASASAPANTQNTDAGFVPLLDTRQTAGWKLCGSGTVESKNGVVTLTAASGTEGCWWYPLHEFHNFHLKVEFRIPESGGNSGIYVRMPYIGNDLGARLRSYQVDVSDLPMGMEATGAICGVKPPSDVPMIDREWNTLEFTVVGQHYAVWLNGIHVNSFDGNKSSSGYIGFQLYKKQVQYRNLLVKELSP